MLKVEDIKLGDKVVGKYTGVGVAGKVVGICSYECYASGFVRNPNLESKPWEKFAPNYKEEPVILTLFEEPQKNIRREELQNLMEKTTVPFLVELQEYPELWKKFIDSEYERQPMTYIIAYNINDVVKL